MLYLPSCDGGVKKPVPCLLAALEGAKPRSFWMFCLIDIVHKMYRKMNEQCV
uniref:Uncharacterized protein n=1 Tax=Arion vulgaris TaxID=1028688 RepID=A0A0B6ZB84_9EUPU